jgi:hypothetical protein
MITLQLTWKLRAIFGKSMEVVYRVSAAACTTLSRSGRIWNLGQIHIENIMERNLVVVLRTMSSQLNCYVFSICQESGRVISRHHALGIIMVGNLSLRKGGSYVTSNCLLSRKPKNHPQFDNEVMMNHYLTFWEEFSQYLNMETLRYSRCRN